MVDKTMTSVRFNDEVRRMLDIMCAEQLSSMSDVLENAVKFYYQNVSFMRLQEMIYEFEGRTHRNTGLVGLVQDNDLDGAREVLKTLQLEYTSGIPRYLLARILERVNYLG